jgi:hypothetical protein
MTVILEEYTIAETGLVEIPQPVNLTISAREAQRRVNSWLCLDITMMLTNGEPTLLVGKGVRWQVPVFFTAPHVGRVGEVGCVTVDAGSGVIDKNPQTVGKMLRATKKLSKTLPPFQPRAVPPEYLATNVQPTILPAPRLKLQPNSDLVIATEPTTG